MDQRELILQHVHAYIDAYLQKDSVTENEFTAIAYILVLFAIITDQFPDFIEFDPEKVKGLIELTLKQKLDELAEKHK